MRKYLIILMFTLLIGCKQEVTNKGETFLTIQEAFDYLVEEIDKGIEAHNKNVVAANEAHKNYKECIETLNATVENLTNRVNALEK